MGHPFQLEASWKTSGTDGTWYNSVMNLQDTIAVISTAEQESAISIIRMSGSQAIAIADSLFSKDLGQRASHTITYGNIINPLTHAIVDEVLVSLFRAPRSYTTEDIVEINCHGGIVVTHEILSLCLAQGARMAEAGEFSERALINGRINLTQAEAIMDVISARSVQSAALAVQGLSKDLEQQINPLSESLLEIIATIEVNIDYPEYDDVETLTTASVLPKAIDLAKQLDHLVEASYYGKIVRDGVKTAIIGKPNVGKSSLLNALLQEDRAIVSDEAGTTRDVIEGWVRLAHVDLNLMDTAGLRDTDNKVEKLGIDRSYKALEQAELVLLVFDGSIPLDEEDERLLALTADRPRLLIYNKLDQGGEHDGIAISALHHEIKPLLAALDERFAQTQRVKENPTLVNQRQIAHAQASALALRRAITQLQAQDPLDFVTLEFNDAYKHLQAILYGDQEKVNVLDEIFKRFCLGK